MQRRSLFVLGLLLAGMAFTLLQVSSAAPAPVPAPTGVKKSISNRLALQYKMTPDDMDRLLKSFGAEALIDLGEGSNIELPGLGVLRIVRVAEHKDLKDGRPVTYPAYNVVEFLPTPDVTGAVNNADIKPAVTVPAYEFTPIPDGNPGTRMPNVRNPGVRTKS
jgi:nucleoid DNA-binding protein